MTRCDFMPQSESMFYIVLVGERVAGLFTSPVDAALRCKGLDGARVVLCQPNEDTDMI